MLKDYTLTLPTEADLAAVAATMRAADVAEVWASHRLAPDRALRLSVAASAEVWTVGAQGTPLCLIGIGRSPGGTLLAPVSIPWMLASEAVMGHRRAILEISAIVIPLWRQRYGAMTNWVDARNRASLRWLRWLGFEIEPAAPFGPDGLPFHRFVMR